MPARPAKPDPPDPAHPREPKRRAEVIRSAASLFDERGYHDALLADIAAAAGIRKTTLYHYFGSKDEILGAIHDEFIDQLLDRQVEREALRSSAEVVVLEIMGDILDLMETHRGYVRVFFEHQRELPAKSRAEIVRKRRHYETMVRDVIARGVEEGTFRTDLDVDLATLALFGICNWSYQWYDPDGPLRVRRIAYVFWDMLLNGIAEEPAD